VGRTKQSGATGRSQMVSTKKEGCAVLQRPRLAGLPTPVAELLQASCAAETQAVGPARREVFRQTRQLLGGAAAAGDTTQELAECPGVNQDSLMFRYRFRGHLTGD
jgi:hypothetical protein